MAILEDVLIKAKQAFNYAGQKTGEALELSKLRVSAAETEKKIADEYREIGKMVYKAAKEQSDCADYVNEKVAVVDALKAELAEKNAKINELRRLRKCAQCGHVNAAEAEYCAQCGTKL